MFNIMIEEIRDNFSRNRIPTLAYIPSQEVIASPDNKNIKDVANFFINQGDTSIKNHLGIMNYIKKTASLISLEQLEKSTHYDTLRTNHYESDTSIKGDKFRLTGGMSFGKQTERGTTPGKSTRPESGYQNFFYKTFNQPRFQTLEEDVERENDQNHLGVLSRSNMFSTKQDEFSSSKEIIVRRNTRRGTVRQTRRMTKIESPNHQAIDLLKKERMTKAQKQWAAMIKTRTQTEPSIYAGKFMKDYDKKLRFINSHERLKINEKDDNELDMKTKQIMELRSQLRRICQKPVILTDGMPVKMDVLVGEGSFFKVRCVNREFPAIFEIKSLGSDKVSGLEGLEIYVSLKKHLTDENSSFKFFSPKFQVSFKNKEIGKCTEFYVAVIVKKSECLQFSMSFKLKTGGFRMAYPTGPRTQKTSITAGSFFPRSKGSLGSQPSNTEKAPTKSTLFKTEENDFEEEHISRAQKDHKWINLNIDNLADYYESNLIKPMNMARLLDRRISESRERKKRVVEQKKTNALNFLKRSDDIRKHEQMKRDYVSSYVLLCSLGTNWKSLVIMIDYVDVAMNVLKMAKFSLFFRQLKNFNAAKIQRNFLNFVQALCPTKPLRDLRYLLVYSL